MLLDQLGLLAVEGHHAHRGALFAGFLPERFQVLHDTLGFYGVALVLVQAIDLDQFQRLELADARLGMAYWHIQAVAVERGVGETDQFAVGRAVVDLQGGAGQGVTRQLQKVRAVLDLTAVPGVLERFALLFVSVLVGLVAIEQFGLVTFDAAGEERCRWHLLLVATDYRDLATEQGRQGELHRHLRRLVVDHRVEQAVFQRQYAAGHVRVHQPHRAQCHQPQWGAKFEEFAQPARALAG
ncbi:hypothetical protein D3C78_1047430 [compost metagenome]